MLAWSCQRPMSSWCTSSPAGPGGGLKLTGAGRLLGTLTKMVVEGALEGELDDHLGYAKHDPEGRDGGN